MKKGFTLVELMVAAAILVSALAGLLGVFVGSFNLIESAKGLTVALNHARGVMEEVRDVNIPAFVVSQDWTSWAQTDFPGGGGCNTLSNESVQITYPSGTSAVPLEVVVTVNWTEKGRQRKIELSTLMTVR